MTQLGFYETYLLDACCITRLDGKDRRNYSPPQFSQSERAIIWTGLESLVGAGRLKIIRQVKDELRHLYPEGLQHLAAYPGHRLVIHRTAATIAEYQALLRKYPDIAPKPRRGNGDPWLILAAKRFRFPIVTMELSRADRSPRANKKMRIPDICALENITYYNLRRLAQHENWLP
ncbi:MAG: DUF4411 family protein [Chloroflexi bacterium]|nr:DUF4411 family protein [Chloroflexota bacterium]